MSHGCAAYDDPNDHVCPPIHPVSCPHTPSILHPLPHHQAAPLSNILQAAYLTREDPNNREEGSNNANDDEHLGSSFDTNWQARSLILRDNTH